MIFFTSILSNYLPKALALAESVLLHHDQSEFCIYIYDYATCSVPSVAQLENIVSKRIAHQISFNSSFELVPHADIYGGRYGVVEACTAVKPFIVASLFEKHDQVTYFDPDIYVYESLDLKQSSRQSSLWDLALTPHILSPSAVSDATPLSERLFLMNGIFNLGFFSIRRTNESLLFLEWWCHIVDQYGVNNTSAGLFVDQKPLDFAPAFIDRLFVARHPGWNIGWWNILCDGRTLVGPRDILYAGEFHPLVFFHFSNLDGFDANALLARPLRSMLPRASKVIRLSTNEHLYALFLEYNSRVAEISNHLRRFGLRMAVYKSGKTGELVNLYVNSELYRLHCQAMQGDSLSADPSLLKGSLFTRIVRLFALAKYLKYNLLRHIMIQSRLYVLAVLSPSLYNYSSEFRSPDSALPPGQIVQ